VLSHLCKRLVWQLGWTVVAVAGGATLLAGMSLFRDKYNAEVANKEAVERALTGWRPL